MANTAGTAGGTGSPQGGMQGWDAAVNTQPIPMSNAGTRGAGVPGVALVPTSLAADFARVVTQLVLRNVQQYLRFDAVMASMGSYLRARNVPGTNKFVYTAFADLGVADVLLEGIPPESATLQFDNFDFTGTQRGKVVAITDQAEVLSPFELYAIAAEKVAWNAISTLEADLATAVASGGVTITPVAATGAGRVVEVVTGMKLAAVPTFPDGGYHGFINPVDSASLMTEAGELGWTDTMKYARPEDLLNGEIGKFRGVRWIETTRVAAAKAVVFGPEYAAIGDFQTIQAYRVAPGGDHADPLAQRGLVGWKGWFGVSTVNYNKDGAVNVGPATNPNGIRYWVGDITP